MRFLLQAKPSASSPGSFNLKGKEDNLLCLQLPGAELQTEGESPQAFKKGKYVPREMHFTWIMPPEKREGGLYDLQMPLILVKMNVKRKY